MTSSSDLRSGSSGEPRPGVHAAGARKPVRRDAGAVPDGEFPGPQIRLLTWRRRARTARAAGPYGLICLYPPTAYAGTGEFRGVVPADVPPPAPARLTVATASTRVDAAPLLGYRYRGRAAWWLLRRAAARPHPGRGCPRDVDPGFRVASRSRRLRWPSDRDGPHLVGPLAQRRRLQTRLTCWFRRHGVDLTGTATHVTLRWV